MYAVASCYRDILDVDHNRTYLGKHNLSLMSWTGGIGTVEAVGEGSTRREGDRVTVQQLDRRTRCL